MRLNCVLSVYMWITNSTIDAFRFTHSHSYTGRGGSNRPLAICFHYDVDPNNCLDLKHTHTHTHAHYLDTQGIEGQIAPWPSALSDLDPNQWIVIRWDVNSTIKSFGQLLLLGRAVHCLLQLRSCFNSSSPTEPCLVVVSVVFLCLLMVCNCECECK